jgi:hypothetical protein
MRTAVLKHHADPTDFVKNRLEMTRATRSLPVLYDGAGEPLSGEILGFVANGAEPFLLSPSDVT